MVAPFPRNAPPRELGCEPYRGRRSRENVPPRAPLGHAPPELHCLRYPRVPGRGRLARTSTSTSGSRPDSAGRGRRSRIGEVPRPHAGARGVYGSLPRTWSSALSNSNRPRSPSPAAPDCVSKRNLLPPPAPPRSRTVAAFDNVDLRLSLADPSLLQTVITLCYVLPARQEHAGATG